MEEEKRKTLKEEQKYMQQNEQYKDRLSRRRHDDQLGNVLQFVVFLKILYPFRVLKSDLKIQYFDPVTDV